MGSLSDSGFVVADATQLSRNLYMTYARDLNSSQYEVILVEYEQSERISWILSRNEDRTFALDFRVRHVF